MLANTPSLDELTVFTSLVRLGDLRALALQTGVPSKVIAERIKDLETKLAIEIFEKDESGKLSPDKRLVLTEQGESLFTSGRKVLDTAEAMMDGMSHRNAIPKGTLYICSSTGFSRKVLGPILSKFQQVYPDLEIQLEALDRRINLLEEGYHLDIRVGSENEPGLCYRNIASNYRILCASPKYLKDAPPLKTPADLQNHRCLVIRERDQQPRLWSLQGPNNGANMRVRGAMSSNMGEIVKQWTLEGNGIALRSLWDVREELESGELVRVLPFYSQQADIVAAYPERLSDSVKIQVCLEFWPKAKCCGNTLTPTAKN
ncbi:MAG: LysR family transcriptional regulator [Limnobacter sp.]|nr:LysR family transcriptional regulator [Limnobacter sp.]